MSLSSFLLGADASKSKGKAIDTGLDDLFKSSTVAPSVVPAAVKPPTAFIAKDKKRKDAPSNADTTSKSAKRAKAHTPKADTAPSKQKDASKKLTREKNAAPEVGAENIAEVKDQGGLSESEDAVAGPSTSTALHSDENSSDEEGDPSKLIHESLLKGDKTKGSTKKKYVPPEETPEQRDSRTIFVGNVPSEVVTNRPLQKQLKRHILSFVPTAKIESVRFRSVAFSKPTASTSSDQSSKDSRQHNRDRAATWRESKGSLDEEALADRGKTFLSQKEKKRIFFIKQELHSEVDSVNAYVVFAHAPPPAEGSTSTVLDPYEAAKIAIKEADGSVFNGHSLRVDTAVKGKGKGKAGDLGVEIAEDPKATVFVGNLDFACKEEDVRAFFEKLMVEEKGVPGESKEEDSDEEGEDEKDDDQTKDEKPVDAPSRKAWVKRVRIIRDKDTLLGKGFGYVQFSDRSCVDEVLALEESRLKFAKRKLRVQRCKTLPGGSKSSKPTSTHSGKLSASSKQGRPERSRPSTTERVSVPKGDPTLGSKIASLSKEERKQVKSSDADRVARRLAKKKAKALADKGVKSRDSGKDRERVRKRPAKERAGAPEKKKAKTGRVRSGNALAKMNRKK